MTCDVTTVSHAAASMALEGVFARVLTRLPENDAIALASQKRKVIQLLLKELLAEGLLVVKEERASTALASSQRLGVVASPWKDSSVSVGTETLAGSKHSSSISIDACRYLFICLYSYIGIASRLATVHLVTLTRLLFEPVSEPCPVNDLSTEESPTHSDQSLEAASVVTDESVFVDGDVDEEDESASNKVSEAAGIGKCKCPASVLHAVYP